MPTRVLEKGSNLYWELRLGISTRGWEPENHRDDNFYYCTTLYKDIFRVLNHLKLNEEDTFVDLGCGKGRVICCAAQYNLRKVIGVEYDNRLFMIAERNIKSLKEKKTNIKVINVLAEQYDYSVGNIFYLFNPFSENILKQVIYKIKDSLSNNKRQIRIVYVNPKFENQMENIDGIEKLYEGGPSSDLRTKHKVNFYSIFT